MSSFHFTAFVAKLFFPFVFTTNQWNTNLSFPNLLRWEIYWQIWPFFNCIIEREETNKPKTMNKEFSWAAKLAQRNSKEKSKISAWLLYLCSLLFLLFIADCFTCCDGYSYDKDIWHNVKFSDLTKFINLDGRYECPRVNCSKHYKDASSLQRHIRWMFTNFHSFVVSCHRIETQKFRKLICGLKMISSRCININQVLQPQSNCANLFPLFVSFFFSSLFNCISIN